MARIWKYPLKVTDEQFLDVPCGTQPLSVAVQNGTPCLWVLVDEEESLCELLRIRTFGTGQLITDLIPGFHFLGTYLIVSGNFVGHVFWRRPETLMLEDGK